MNILGNNTRSKSFEFKRLSKSTNNIGWGQLYGAFNGDLTPVYNQIWSDRWWLKNTPFWQRWVEKLVSKIRREL